MHIMQFLQNISEERGSAIDLDLGPPIDPSSAKNYKKIKQVRIHTDNSKATLHVQKNAIF